jgi:hypothetical protein
VAGGGRGCGHGILLAGAGVRSHYLRGYCPLPFLVESLLEVSVDTLLHTFVAHDLQQLAYLLLIVVH